MPGGDRANDVLGSYLSSTVGIGDSSSPPTVNYGSIPVPGHLEYSGYFRVESLCDVQRTGTKQGVLGPPLCHLIWTHGCEAFRCSQSSLLRLLWPIKAICEVKGLSSETYC